jgi:hypothetical protein
LAVAEALNAENFLDATAFWGFGDVNDDMNRFAYQRFNLCRRR